MEEATGADSKKSGVRDNELKFFKSLGNLGFVTLRPVDRGTLT